MSLEMKTKKIYERLRREHYFYCQGKNPKFLFGACEYIAQFLVHESSVMPQFEIAYKYGTTESTIGKRYREIMKLLNIDMWDLL